MTMMTTTDFVIKWNEFKDQKGYLQRLDPNHPMDFFIGVSDKGYDELVLVTVIEPAKLISSKALEVEKAIRKDGKWATQIYSVISENQGIFSRLCLDLVECSQNCKTEAEGLSNVTKRYLAWQKLFARMNETLPISTLKGLIGELDFIKELLNKGYSKDMALASWLGPNGADRDFIIDNTWFENKAISTGKNTVTISSLNQLETDNKGFLSIVYVDETSMTDSQSFSIKSYIDNFREILSDAPNALTIFEQNLVSIGYLDKKAYEDICFKLGNRSYYRVDESFPKLIPQNVALEIVGARYDLSLVGIEKWITEDNQIWS